MTQNNYQQSVDEHKNRILADMGYQYTDTIPEIALLANIAAQLTLLHEDIEDLVRITADILDRT